MRLTIVDRVGKKLLKSPLCRLAMASIQQLHLSAPSPRLDAVEWAVTAVGLGAGEILLTSMDRDGTKLGFDIPLTAAVARMVRVPVIASGGCANPEHMLEVFQKTDASAALAASIFHFQECSIRDVKTYLRKNGVNVRL